MFTEAPDEARARADWFYAQRAYPEDTAPANAHRRAAREARSLKVASVNTASVAAAAEPPQLEWTSIGPTPIATGLGGPYGTSPGAGRVPALAPVGDGTIAYLGGAQGGVWKTVDAGATWTPVFDNVIGAGEVGMAIGALAVDPATPATVYAGTGEASLSRSYFGGGIFKSTNAGASWTKIGGATFDTCHVSDLRIRGATILAAVVRAGWWTRTCVGGVYRSTDGGMTWSRTLADTARQPSPTRTVEVGAFDVVPGVPNVWFATVWGDDPAGAGGPVFKSLDDGVTWSRLGGGLPTADNGRTSVATAPSDRNRIYAATTSTRFADWANVTGVFVSSDGGSTWVRRDPPNSEVYGSACSNGLGLAQPGQCDYDNELIVDPANSSTVYFAGITLWKSTDAGVTWRSLDREEPPTHEVHFDYHAFAFDSGGRLWAGTDGGAYRSADGGWNWTNLNASLSLTQFEWGISGQADADGPIFGGTQDQATNRRNADGRWQLISSGDGGATAWNPAEPNLVYVSVYYQYIRRSNDGGTNVDSWPDAEFYAKGDAFDFWNFHPPLVMSPSDSKTLYFASTRVWRSTDRIVTWDPISPHFGFDRHSSISALGATSDPDVLYAGTNNGQLRVTQDATGDQTWVATQANGLPNRTFTEIEAKPGAPGTAYVTASGFDPAGGSGHLFKTTDYGAHWTNVSGNLPNVPVNAIAIDWRTAPETLYVGTDVGVLWSYDGGSSWHNSSTGLPPIVVMDVKLDTAAGKLIAATHGRGMYTAPLPPPTAPAFSIADVSVSEGNAGSANASFTVSVVPGSTSALAVDYATVNGGAEAPGDFEQRSGRLTIPAGETSGTISVPIHGDGIYEQNETFSVVLSNPSAGTAISDGEATGTIADDDPVPSVTVSDAEIEEGNDGVKNVAFTLTLTGATKFQAKVDHLTQDDSARGGEDYVHLTDGSHTSFAANGPAVQTREVLVAVNGDTTVEADERFRLVLTAVANATAARTAAVGLIRNDDTEATPQPPAPQPPAPQPPAPQPPAPQPPAPQAPAPQPRPARCVVPRVVGQSLRAAKAKVARARCRVGLVRYKAAGAKKKGRVLAQKPKPRTRLRAGARINLVVGR